MHSQILNNPTPEVLPEIEIGNIIAAVGNHENKALLCAAMKPETVYTAKNLLHLYVSLQGENPQWVPSASSLFGYCEESLAPIGLVAKEIIDDSQSVVGFVKTDLGDHIGESLSGHLLDLSLRYPETSLYRIFGKTGTVSEEGSRSPAERIRLFEELLTLPDGVRITDLGLDVFKQSQHISSLAESGLVTAGSWNPSDSLVKYEAGNNPVGTKPLRSDASELSRAVVRITKEALMEPDAEDTVATPFDGSGTLTVKDIIAKLKVEGDTYDDLEPSDLVKKVQRAVGHLVTKGELVVGNGYTREVRSSISLTQKQRDLLEEIVNIVYKFQDNDEAFIQEGRDKAQLIITNTESVKTLVAKAKENSTNANSRPRAETAEEIRRAVVENPGLSVRELESILGGIVSRKSISVILKELETSGVTKRSRNEGKNVWFDDSYQQE